ncbi:hypothetical protein BC936DRAFT_147425 [Jimgerdemannia flammicorona]|uniref:Uncharacterized protein n=1 Tax=Jimgerdemannia flammicorona TaxID=994334 RepID=A0A433D5B7_9FUNG|nr:hypothetical protein BC936DRAFT_147425 [Jimgerdemannia flammicorona]
MTESLISVPGERLEICNFHRAPSYRVTNDNSPFALINRYFRANFGQGAPEGEFMSLFSSLSLVSNQRARVT